MRKNSEILIVNQQFHDINPLVCGSEQCEPGHSYGPAVRMYWLLHYVEKGCGVLRADGREYKVEKGQIFVIRPMETTVYQADIQNPWRYHWIGFTAGISLPNVLLSERVIINRDAEGIFRRMQESSQMNQGKELFLTGLIYQLLSSLNQREKGIYDYVAQVRTYIDSSYMQDVSISRLAGQMNVNRCALSTQFRQKTGKSPQQYLVSCRMEQSCRLMDTYGYGPGQAAIAVGYPDVCAFSKMFKRFYGISPSEFRKQSKEKAAHKDGNGTAD